MSIERYDVVVAGGGPAGLVTAALVAGRGHRVLLLERELRPHLVSVEPPSAPAIVAAVGALLGISEWAEFDRTLLDMARARGVEVRGRCAAVNVVTENELVTGLRHRPDEGPALTVRARCVVDASGSGSLLRRHVAGNRASSGLTLYACFEGDTDGLGPRRFPFGGGWFWAEPLGRGLTCLGAVVRPDLADRVHEDPEGALSAFAEECSPVRDFLAGATRVRGGHGQVRVRPHWPYAGDRLWRPGMLLVGDAACSAEPPLSRGVHLACYGAVLAARALDGFLSGTRDDEADFEEFERRYREVYGAVHDTDSLLPELPGFSAVFTRAGVSR